MNKNALAARERLKMSRKIAKMAGDLFLMEKSGLLDGFEAYRLRICLGSLRNVHDRLIASD